MYHHLRLVVNETCLAFISTSYSYFGIQSGIQAKCRILRGAIRHRPGGLYPGTGLC